MNSKSARNYASPLRESQANETRERILEAVAKWMEQDAHADFTYDDIAKTAGVERRTVYRHFSSREALLEAFWTWINLRLQISATPSALDELVAGPSVAFRKFDESEGVIRGSLHTRAGRSMRMAAAPNRREAFQKALGVTPQRPHAEELQKLEIVAHALYSAAAWEAMRDYAGVSGAEAGDAATWALEILTNAILPPNEHPSSSFPHAQK